MRYLMVSTYAPTHCGIAAYAEQAVDQLRAQGHVVDVVSPDGQGNVDFAWDLRGGSKILKLFRPTPVLRPGQHPVPVDIFLCSSLRAPAALGDAEDDAQLHAAVSADAQG